VDDEKIQLEHGNWHD